MSDNNGQNWERIDFRRPSRLSRDQLRSLDIFHDAFTRRLSNGIGTSVRATAVVEMAKISQVSWEDYLRTLPSFTMMATIEVSPLPAAVLVEADTSIALALVDRLLGGRGQMSPPRRPTDLEDPPLRRLAMVAGEAIGDAFGQFIPVEPTLASLDYSPQLVAITAPSNMVLVLTCSLTVPSAQIAGDLNVCIPLVTLTPALDRIVAHANHPDDGAAGPSDLMDPIVRELAVTVEARLNATEVPASMIARLALDDVIVLDHRMTRPATATVQGQSVFTGHLGRRGRRFALSVADHPFAAGGPGGTSSRHGAVGSRGSGPIHDGYEEQHDA
jgi:flagellar motor switch protein FliM